MGDVLKATSTGEQESHAEPEVKQYSFLKPRKLVRSAGDGSPRCHRDTRPAFHNAKRLLKLQVMDGVLLPSNAFNVDTLTDALRYKPLPRDIFIATYPKAGTTWTQYIVWALLNLDNNMEPLPSFKSINYDLMPFLEFAGRKVVEKLPEPRVIKHHLVFSKSPYHPEAKYLAIVRNPFDCVVSFYHHCLDDRVNLEMAEDATFDDFFEDFMDGHVPFGDYFELVLSWYAHRRDPNVLFYYYEKLIENPMEGYLKIADFIDKSIGEKLRADEALLADVVRKTSFKNLKATVMISHDDEDSVKEEKGDEELFAPFRNFFRKGVVGGWRSYLKADQERKLRKVYEKHIQGTEMWDVWKKHVDLHNTA
ncbi:hypothetical protein HPB47_021611 [Ixodes persulcatus]|uniref:Uncharacterized protein n=1 Tax=Ixodes persulcatus TaxID=34615 RepID=A0AC60QDW8_IXOPE|nr:hypothetical protein HPB47_021611 [Ixodes persulcatus]